MDVLSAFAIAVMFACMGWFAPSDLPFPPRLSTALTIFNVDVAPICDKNHSSTRYITNSVSLTAPLLHFADFGDSPTQHTLDHLACPACEQERADAMMPDSLAQLRFQDAANKWLRDHSQYIEPRTKHDYQQYIKALNVHFALLPLRDIHIGHIRAYQRSRRIKAGASRINMEMSTLGQVLKNANLWYRIAPVYKPLPTKKEGSGKPYSAEQKQLLVKTALGKNTRWHLAGHCLRIMFNTGVGFGELKGTRRADFDLGERFIWVCMTAKNTDRQRRVPLNDEAFASMVWILERWESAGGNNADDFLLFHRAHTMGSEPDFTKPMGSIKTAFYAIRKKAGLPTGAWEGPRAYDCRVTFITEKLSSGTVNVETLEKVVGHVGRQMIKRYYKPALDTMRDVVGARRQPDRQVEKKDPQRVRPFIGWSSTTFFG